MSDQLIVERGGLEKKEKGELQAIILALGGTSTARARKSELIDQIMVLSGAAELMGDPADADEAAAEQLSTDQLEFDGGGPGQAAADGAGTDEVVADGRDAGAEESTRAGATGDVDDDDDDDDGDADDDDDGDEDDDDDVEGRHDDDDDDDDDDGDAQGGRAEARPAKENGRQARSSRAAEPGVNDGSSVRTTGRDQRPAREPRGRSNDRARSEERGNRVESGNRNDRQQGNDRTQGRGGNRSPLGDHPVGPDGEPLADWELAMLADGNQGGNQQGNQQGSQSRGNDRPEAGDDVDPNNRRSRRRGRGRGRERDEAPFEAMPSEPLPVSGVLDLREEGYGFLRVDGCLPSKDDVYVSVKQVRQYGLRKGDVLTGLSRPATRNEKNPGFHQIDTVNDLPAEEGRNRVRFDDLTPLFPDERLRLEMKDEPLNMTTRIIDLVAPIGKGQRALIVSPPKAGKTTVIKDIARAIETNNPEVQLIVLLLDERPEEVTDMSRHLDRGHVVASTFDRPPEEHCAVAELTIERAKRLVEAGQDVCLIVDGITRLSRAYNLTAPQTGRAMSGGLDAAALYPPKRFFGAARNLEEGGSLTILATALVDTGSRMDEVIFEEFKGTGNCEIRLDRRLAEKRLFPAIDIDGSSTRHEELLFDRQQLQAAWKLRRVLSAMGDDGSSGAAIEMLVDRLKTFKTNADFLNEIAKSPSL